MRKNTIRIIYGPGNGKSASAVGYGLLGALAGKKVIIVQFLKGVLEERKSSGDPGAHGSGDEGVWFRAFPMLF